MTCTIRGDEKIKQYPIQEIDLYVFDTDKGEIQPEPGRYSVLFDSGEWSHAIWDGEWKEFIGTKPPHLWFVVEQSKPRKKRRRKWRFK